MSKSDIIGDLMFRHRGNSEHFAEGSFYCRRIVEALRDIVQFAVSTSIICVIHLSYSLLVLNSIYSYLSSYITNLMSIATVCEQYLYLRFILSALASDSNIIYHHLVNY